MTTKEFLQSKHKYRNYEFKDQKRDEDIIIVLRRHWLTFVIRFMPIVFGVVAIITMHFFVTGFMPELLAGEGSSVLLFVESLMAMILWLIAFIFWIDYYFDVWIITDRRIVDIEQMGLFRRNVSELDHSKIQDVTTEIHGILPTLLKYGLVYVQTAGKKTRFVFKQVPRPMMIRKMILQLQSNINNKKKMY